MPPEKPFGVIVSDSCLVKIGDYRDLISGTPKEDQFETDLSTYLSRLTDSPHDCGEPSKLREGPKGAIGVVYTGGSGLFWVRYIVYRRLPDPIVMVVDFGGR